jgi:hypothetical protein
MPKFSHAFCIKNSFLTCATLYARVGSYWYLFHGGYTWQFAVTSQIFSSIGHVQAGWLGVWVLAGAGSFSLLHHIQPSSGAHPASYPMGTRGCFPGGKAVRVWSWQLTSIYFQGQEWVELYLHSPSTPWGGTQLKHRDNSTITQAM